MVLTDNELGMLEQFTYYNEKVPSRIGLELTNVDPEGMSIEDILNKYDERVLKQLEDLGDETIEHVSAKEWAGIIRYLKSSRMRTLILTQTLKNRKKKTIALCFTEPKELNAPKEAIVAFKGTTGPEEWEDNVKGMVQSDTDCQQRARDFIESLPYESITVTGHSKGGNKAMYVTVTSDKVNRCVAYDAQGFSKQFLDKYWGEIDNKGGLIKTYSLSTDYVHALLFPIPNAHHHFCRGYGVSSIGEHHCLNSLFKTDAQGKIIVNAQNEPIIEEIAEDDSIIKLHQFTTFAINNADDQDLDKMATFLSELLGIAFAGDEFDKDGVIQHCAKSQDAFATFIAYLVKYMAVNNLSADEINAILSSLGLNELDEYFTFKILNTKILGLAGLINFAKKELTDNDGDFFIRKAILPGIQALKFGDLPINLAALWESIDQKVKTIDGAKGHADVKLNIGEVRDFTIAAYDLLVDAINHMEDIGAISVTAWTAYRNDRWYPMLFAELTMGGITSYFEKLSEANQVSRVKIDELFNDIETIDRQISRKNREDIEALRYVNRRLSAITHSIVAA